MLRGEVLLAVLDPTLGSEQAGTRPVVVVSRDALNSRLNTIVVVPLTGREHKPRIYPSHAVLPAGTVGLKKDSIVLAEQIRVISKQRIRKQMGLLPQNIMHAIDEALRNALALD